MTKRRKAGEVFVKGKQIVLINHMDNPYEIPMDPIKTELHILRWIRHLSEKSWVDTRMIHTFIDLACNKIEVRPYPLP